MCRDILSHESKSQTLICQMNQISYFKPLLINYRKYIID